MQRLIGNGVDKKFYFKTKRIYSITPNKSEWISVLTSINANGETIIFYYIFKEVKSTRNYLAFCEHGATFDMQKMAR